MREPAGEGGTDGRFSVSWTMHGREGRSLQIFGRHKKRPASFPADQVTRPKLDGLLSRPGRG